MEFKTLKNTSVEELLSVFNLSFSDYIVPFHLTKEVLISKINAEKIDFNLSVGAFESDQLVGFILNAEKTEDNQRIIYNAGTGVVPESRGKGLVRKMYDFILPLLKDRKVDTLLLEVIDGNKQAIRTYENLGFTMVRRLLCFNGNINLQQTDSNIVIKELEEFQWDNLRSFWDIEPSWQGSVFVLEDMRKDCIVLGAYKDEKLAGYAFYNPAARKIYQIAVDKNHRRQGIATRLFEAIKEKNNGEAVSLNNVDEVSESTCHFLNERIGLKNWVSQFEMKRAV
ncbi:ribosomal protein S18 acetylase RimI-like enzyme [Chryseobacterium rhizosphaerae]|uniref:Ribosomal protein S18 acetylase RimI-like enzyme n=1 Tax=Chryseobacterium rhizosphaerae TaxID=395937 RepID=A0AAE4C3T1_9FLAO|nr:MULTISPECIES: GNAT family N-acetyltransferase [Chryseobacterium]MBL3550234.1 GNAT family N-acetyltransferase [Chryseobacterium sp. KMC2]MDR6527252.1 ribosomal protein S18 acetylase RimI-like enzyme [Chryseobacterium rhizosphaerae]